MVGMALRKGGEKTAMSFRRRPTTVDEATAHEARIFQRKVELLNDPEFLESNREALQAHANGERGLSLDEFRAKHPYPRP